MKKKYSYWNTLSERIPENILPLTEDEKHELLRQWEESVHTENVQPLDAVLLNIRNTPLIVLGAVPPWLMDRVKETVDHYVHGQWWSSISVSGIIAEFLTFDMLENHVQKKGIADLIRFSRKLGNQEGRLRTLKDLGIVTEEEYGELDRIRSIRNQYIHLNVSSAKIKDDCLDVVRNLVSFLNKHEQFRFKFRLSGGMPEDLANDDSNPRDKPEEFPI